MFKKLALTFFLFLSFLHFSVPRTVLAVDPTPTPTPTAPFPELRLPCTKEKDVEFHSLRPYQAAPCGDANKALYCSNDLIFTETFKMGGNGDCQMRNEIGDHTFTCEPNYKVDPHDLYVSLDQSELPILGNTEDVKNSQNDNEELDNAQKMNEYVSWYLSGVSTRAEYGKTSEDEVVNFSGPLQKLLPSVIAESQRIEIIKSVEKETSSKSESDGSSTTGNQNHNQTVVCAKKAVQIIPSWLTNIIGVGAVGIGTAEAVPCYGSGGSIYKLKMWDKKPAEVIKDKVSSFITKILSFNRATELISKTFVNRWPYKFPPLPWDNGNGKPFETDEAYQKAYNEWRGDWCAVLPNPWNIWEDTLACVRIPGVTNSEWADLFQYIPLSETTDKEGAEKIDSVQISGDSKTEVQNQKIGNSITPPLYFAHTEEVRSLSELLNKTYTPKDVESVPIPETTEKNECSVVNIRANPGDNLFPGDPKELQIKGVEYRITKATCHEVKIEKPCTDETTGIEYSCYEHTFDNCPATVTITINTSTLTPNADEIFSTTVADSMSTFRKMYPKVEMGAPVSCIADIPTVTNVSYDATKSQKPNGGGQSFRVENKPTDGTNVTPQLTFPNIGSVYEYFLKGIQTALRPKGYGSLTPESGSLCTATDPTITASCEGATPQNVSGLIGKEEFAEMAGEGGRGLECYDYVVGRAISEDIDPALALWVWLNESRASNYSLSVHDFGVINSAYDKNITAQMGEFIRLKKLLVASRVPECAEYGVTNDLQAFAYLYFSGKCNPTYKYPGETYNADQYYNFMLSGIAAMKR